MFSSFMVGLGTVPEVSTSVNSSIYIPFLSKWIWGSLGLRVRVILVPVKSPPPPNPSVVSITKVVSTLFLIIPQLFDYMHQIGEI